MEIRRNMPYKTKFFSEGGTFSRVTHVTSKEAELNSKQLSDSL